jgi:hypothetical protein
MPISNLVANVLSKLSLHDRAEVVFTEEEKTKLAELIEYNKANSKAMSEDIFTEGLADAIAVNLRNMALKK